LLTSGNVPVEVSHSLPPTVSTRIQTTSSGSPFFTLHAMAQPQQPMQLARSSTKTGLDGAGVTGFSQDFLLLWAC